MRNIERFGFIFYSLSITVKPHYLSLSSSTLSPLLLDGSRGRCQGRLRRASSSQRLPFQPKGSSDLGGEENALQIALNQSQRQTQWFTEVNPEGKVPVVKFDDKWVADSDVIVGIIEEKYPEPSLKIPPKFASVFVSFTLEVSAAVTYLQVRDKLAAKLKSDPTCLLCFWWDYNSRFV